MLHHFWWLVPVYLGVGDGGAQGDRTELIFETRPGMEAQVAGVLQNRIDVAGLDVEAVEPGRNGQVSVRLTLGFYQDEIITGLIQPGGFSINSVVDADITVCPAENPPGQLCLPERDSGRVMMIDRANIVDHSSLADASPSFDAINAPSIDFRLTGEGARRFCEWTGDNIGQSLAILVDDQILSAPRVMSAICGGSGQITGSFTFEEVLGLATTIRTAPLPAEVTLISRAALPPLRGQGSAYRDRPARWRMP